LEPTGKYLWRFFEGAQDDGRRTKQPPQSIFTSGVSMSPDSVMSIARHALEVMLLLAMPLLLAALVVGLVVGIFQAATQINESTLSFIPKLIGVAVVLMIGGSWMLQTLVSYTRDLFMSIPRLMG